MRQSLVVFVLVVLAPTATAQERPLLRLRVEPKGVARTWSPVTVRVNDVPADIARRLAGPLWLHLPHTGVALPVQAHVVKAANGDTANLELRWVEPSLAANESRDYDVVPAPGAAEASATNAFHFVDGEDHRDLVLGERPVYRHMTAFDPDDLEQTKKPFHHVFAFGGEGFVTKGPGGEYPHHRGIFLGWSKTRSDAATLDFWSCNRNATQRHGGFDAAAEWTGPVAARSVATTTWNDAQGRAIVTDLRDVTAWRQGEGRTLLDFVVTLRASTKVTLDGDPHHAGFHFRAAQEVAEHAKDTVYVRPAGAQGQKNDNWTGCDWIACLFTCGGKRYAVVHMDHKDNPRPITYSTRPYGRFGSFFRATLEPGKDLVLRYRLVVLDADRIPSTDFPNADPATFAALYADFVTPLAVRVRVTRR